MEDYVAGEHNQVLVSFLATQLSASGPVAYLIAVGVMALLLAMAWRVLR
jgi:hypothetical protein